MHLISTDIPQGCTICPFVVYVSDFQNVS